MDQDILKRLKENDEGAVQWLFSTYFSMLAGVAYRVVEDSDAAKDVVQDVFVRLWTHRHTLQITTSLQSYLRRSVVNAAIDHKRRFYEKNKTSFEEITEQGPETTAIEEKLGEEEMRAQINRAINTLPERCRLIFKLSRYEELTYAQIAQKLDISIKTVENQMSKALKVLRKTLRTLSAWGLWFFVCRLLQ